MGRKILIVGGVAGGASAAARLRRLDETTEIVMLEKGEYISFANCGLPYYIGGEIKEKSALTLQTPQSFHARFNIDVRTSSEAVAIAVSYTHLSASVSAKNTSSKSPPQKNNAPVNTMNTRNPHTRKSCRWFTTTDCLENSLCKS